VYGGYTPAAIGVTGGGRPVASVLIAAAVAAAAADQFFYLPRQPKTKLHPKQIWAARP
jgi:hypothetical protein